MAHPEISRIYRRFRNGLILFWIFFAASNLAQQYISLNYLMPDEQLWHEYIPSLWRFALWALLSIYMLRHILIRQPEMPRFNTLFFLREAGLALLFFALSYGIETMMSYLYMEYMCSMDPSKKAVCHQRFYRLVTNAYLTRLNYYLLVYISVKGFAWFIRVQHERRLRDLEQSRLRSELNELKLQFLNMQIRPHFLFNAHHAIISLIELGEVKRATSMLVRLSTLLRNVLHYSNRNSITLQEELDNLRTYIQLQQLRFGEGIDVRFDVDAACSLMEVPPLLLQPVVENAFHHAFRNREEGLLEISVKLEGTGCRITIADDGEGFAPPAGRTGSYGLSNVEKRIQNYYGSRARFSVASRARSGTEAIFILTA